jgi:2-oxo-3-hexenedioate decarboxylase
MNPLNPEELNSLAQYLDAARSSARAVERISQTREPITLKDAYRVQERGISLRYERGEKYRGLKMGFTSQAKRDQMGLGDPTYGVLTDKMEVNGTFSLKGMIHPKIEPEIAFWTKAELRGKISLEEALSACQSVCPALEILDSRFLGFKYFSLEDVVADNCSSAFFVCGKPIPLVANLDTLQMEMLVDGVVAEEALSSAISGHPAQSIVELCSILDSQGKSLPAGSLVLAGAATQAVSMKPGMRVELRVTGLGSVRVSVNA